MDNINLSEVIRNFDIDYSVKAYGNGHINGTFLAQSNVFVLQGINTDIFKNPYALMENIEKVTQFIRNKVVKRGGDPNRATLTVIKTLDGKSCYRYDAQTYFRMYRFIPDTVTIETEKTNEALFQAGRGIGRFQAMLDDFPAACLHETIPDFHNTPKRIEALKKAIKADVAGRAESVKDEIAFALSRAGFADTVVNGLRDKSIPLRVAHNDTKLNNILFDKNTLEAVCVIDLDTVMPGSALYDFGDALRMGASTAAEDETDLDKVWFDEEAFRCFARGYCMEFGDKLTESEKNLLSFAPKLMTYECGIRFLTDYLDGDTYFKIHRENQNLDRARNHFKLVADIESKEEKLKSIINGLVS